MPNTPRIVVDAMGGDFGPRINVPAAVTAAERGVDIILVGDEDSIRAELDKTRAPDRDRNLSIDIVHAPEVVGMEEKPSDALRKKKDSSIMVCCRLVKEGRADGLISAGNSGATVAAAMFTIGRIRGVERPALAGVMPTEKNPIVLIDVGANVDSKPFHLAQYGLMAEVLAKHVLHIPKPRVGLLSIGEEEGKGNTVTKEAFDLLKSSHLNFIGNVEGRDIFTGDVNVIVCDGFVGNVALKVSEGVAKSFGKILKGELKRDFFSKLGTLFLLPTLTRFARTLDYAEYGGAPLLGVKGSTIVCHGASNVKAITSAILMSARYVRNNANEHIVEQLEAHGDLSRFGRASRKSKKSESS
ncbi:phosphate acyltransferase PlsX [Paucidesulfovibrio longus]|jgi:glycerol-3-phosphate acyltransferase PlsX|uniref:phosphate acyltransferase PlsX n=1 Tax=Paucidesulfovibrio longus TaxID=889 RepID=UPI0003B7BAAE|nr:phosphate acyltransferase PlsX [Paucidesulfovibrio longus]